ncbi:efflux RND transporter periplasmic adaptor subunit [Pelotomaculum isophthalicicum JI]|uniref:Efflux RND transporter periplasmic adaptor subunit n=1 Tax=Pelotomaculum isophthalicicum JI TaxID=947010 RepID=A0A9X4JWD0_9FIRM|nr:efflux RND transporter periplasmic adaptor subunit [Pelotomaculum isophthalicicum]MDF9408997.1 efflux RND transporter periplasmic adaptor subunit [Pelotomaculum isophthalicicum JI]
MNEYIWYTGKGFYGRAKEERRATRRNRTHSEFNRMAADFPCTKGPEGNLRRAAKGVIVLEAKLALKSKTGIVIAFSLILLFVGFVAFNYVRHSEKEKITVNKTETVPVQVAEATLMNLQRVLELTGEIKPAAVVDVHPKVGGEIIEKIFVETGDYVKNGDLIAVLDDDVIKAQLEEATAGLAAAEAGLGQSEANLALLEKDRLRVESLYKENAVSKQELDHINAQYDAAVESKKLAGAQIEKAKAVLNQLQILYREHSIYAPIPGFVAARYVEQGNRTDPAKPVIRISREDELKIVCSVTEKDFPYLKKGMEAEITADAFPEKVFKGVVSVISPTIDPATRTAEIEIHIPNEEYELRSGMFTRIKLHLGERKVLAIPTESVNKMPGTGSYFVYVVEDDKATLKNVKTGITQGNFTEITDGLTEKNLVVTRGQNRLSDGAQVSIEERGVAGSEAS